MCGIGGVALRPDASTDVPGVLDRMVAIQRHRGPDGDGVWWEPSVGVGLCHNRLAILDLTEAARQPMQSADGFLTITFNGEIYNWRELRRRLEDAGVAFRSRSDTEVLLEAYRLYGIDVPNYLRGMFAFAILDERTGTLFCARDRVGKKPFVYAETADGVAFASEIPAVLAMPGCDTRTNHAAVASLLLRNVRHIPDPHTAYLGLSRLRPGHCLLIREGRIQRLWRYWTPTPATAPSTPERVRDVLEDAVRLRQVADVPVGALLSGGTDSSAVVSLMQRDSSTPVRTYALGLDEEDEDLRRARTMAERLGCVHKEFYFDAERELEGLRRLLDTYGEPIALLPLVHTYQLCCAVRDDGMKVVLAGHGADEIFYGYTGHLRTASFSKALPWLEPFARLCPPPLRRGPLAVLAARRGARKAALYRDAERRAWSPILVPEARRELANLVSEELEYWGQLTPSEPYIDESNFVALMVENCHSVTIASDLPAMLASVEMRAPFLDQELISTALATDFHDKVPDPRDSRRLKQILKTAVEDLVPEDLLYAPKRGFGFGIQERSVLRGPWKPIGDEVFARFGAGRELGDLFDRNAVRRVWRAHERGNGVDSGLVAKLFCIGLWSGLEG